MSNIALLALQIGVLVLFVSCCLAYRWRVVHEQDEQLAAHLLGAQTLLQLVMCIQQHRGMASAWLGGDERFERRLEEKAAEVVAKFPALRRLARREAQQKMPCFTLNDVALLMHAWQEVREALPGCSVEQSLARHSYLITQLLSWLADYGETRLVPHVAPRCLGALRNHVARLPALAECLGQMRALGMGIVVRKRCSAVARVRMMYLAGRAEMLLRQARQGAPALPATVDAEKEVLFLTRLVRTRMLQADGITVETLDYYTTATAVIDQVFAWAVASGEAVISPEKDGEHTHVIADRTASV